MDLYFFYRQLLPFLFSLQLLGLDELPLLDVDSLGDDLVPGCLSLSQLEAVKVCEGGAAGLHLHALGPGGLGPLLADLLLKLEDMSVSE